MAGVTTSNLINAYFEDATEPMLFLTGFFQSPEINFYNSEKVEIDVERSEEDVSIAIQDLSVEARKNSVDFFTNKEFTAPIHLEEIPLNSSDLTKRRAGDSPYAPVDYNANVVEYFLRGMRKVQNKIQRAIELQAAQVLLTGVVNIVDAQSNSIYTLDFLPKATHFPTAGTSWATATAAQKIADIRSLSNVIRQDGKRKVDTLIFGEADYENFIQTDGIKDRINFRRAGLADIVAPEVRGNGGTWHGRISIGDNNYDIWTYDGLYKDPVTGNIVKYVPDGKIIHRASSGRMDATFGNIPNIGTIIENPMRVEIPGLPTRFTSGVNGLDLFTNVYMSPNGRQLFGEVGTRPLMIPTAIDTYGTLNTQLGA